MRFAGQTALVTGAGRGIGRAVATELHTEGATVFVTDIDESSLYDLPASNDRMRSVRLDVADPTDWGRARALIEATTGSLDILVNNAGVDMMGPVERIDIEDWRRLMTINVDGVFLGVQSMLELLTTASGARPGGASVVNVSSILGQTGMKDVSAYSASKGAVTVLTKSLALEFADRPIRVNSVHPGFIDGAMLRAGADRAVQAGEFASADQFISSLLAHSPMNRPGQAAEVAAAILFLASDSASYVTGAELNIDGGYGAA